MVKLFTHTDLDGIGCAILAKLAFGDNVNIEYCNYDNINESVKKFINGEINNIDMCNITDISINDELANEIDKTFIKFHLLDHHPTALDLNKYNWCQVLIENEETHIKTSGTELYYHWLISNEYLQRNDTLDRFVECVRDYDTWRWSNLGESGIICKKVNDLFYIYGKEEFILWCITEIQNEEFPQFKPVDELLLENKQREIDNYINSKNKQLIKYHLRGKTCGIVFAEKYASELGNKLCTLHPEIDYVAIINIGHQTVNYRTIKDDIDLGKDVATLFGGGGHPKAAGSQFDTSVLIDTINDIFKRGD